MTANEIRKNYIQFFKKHGHQEIPAAPIVPPDDPTTLFASSGMQQLVPYLQGEVHPMGKRLVNSQPCFRAEDIEQVGDNRHTTFFEMLGNWSLGDYFKKDQLEWFWEFLTKVIKLPKEKLWVTIFDGDKDFNVLSKNGKYNSLTPDVETKNIWIKLGVPEKRIRFYDAKKNWWSRSGIPKQMPIGEIGGPDSEVFFEFTQVEHDKKFGKECHPNCDCGRFLEIGNSVFMQYRKIDERTLEELPNKNVDFGGGLERIVAAASENPDIFQIDLFQDVITTIRSLFQLVDTVTDKPGDYLFSKSSRIYIDQKEEANHQQVSNKSIRVIADHLRAATFLLAEGVVPSNKTQGYILRRLIRRSILHAREHMDISENFTNRIAKVFVEKYANSYPHIKKNEDTIYKELSSEESKFRNTLDKGIREFKKYVTKNQNKLLDPRVVFDLYQTYGFPYELTKERAETDNVKIASREEFDAELEKHKQLSRTSSSGMFKGGLADKSEQTIKLHTATHILHQTLREVLGEHVRQEGSNITAERLRFDFSHNRPLTDVEIQKIEKIINRVIKADLPVCHTIEDKDTAIKSGAMAFFKESYPEKVSVYTIGHDSGKGWYSKELCGGPHIQSTGAIGKIKITKEQSIGSGIHRIYAELV